MNKRVERGLATRQQIVNTAKALLAKSGYAATSIEDLLEHCNISRGALYHHFETKEALFEAVLELVEEEVAQTLAKASSGFEDPLDALRAGCEAWFSLASEPVVRQIVLTDALPVVGWAKWREIDARHGFGRLKAALTLAAARGRMRADLVDTFAHILLAAMIELGFLIARATDRAAATRTARTALGLLLDGLLPPKSERKRARLGSQKR
jgi:AcrR family transcriptional regulator